MDYSRPKLNPHEVHVGLPHPSVVQRTYNLAVIWDVHPPKMHNTQEGLCFLFAGWWRHSCYFVDDIHGDLILAEYC